MLTARFLRMTLNPQTLLLTLYVVFGVFLSQASHIYSYYSRGATRLTTWYKFFGFTTREPSPILVLFFCLIFAVFSFLALQIFADRAGRWTSLTLLPRSIVFCTILCLLSQAIFSSVMRFSYEVFFCFVAIASMVLSRTFLQFPVTGLTIGSPEYQELWDLLKFITPICLGVPILMGGAGFITSFYQPDPGMLRLQLYRHIVMAVYFEIGAVIFLIYPVLKRVLLIRGS